MKLTLPHFGLDEVEIDSDTLIEFPNGLPGFEDCKRFKLFHLEDNSALFWLQSIDDPLVVFSLTDPGLLHIFYEMALTDEELSTLQVGADDELQIAVVLAQQAENNITLQSAVHANAKSPIIINVSKRIALQKLLYGSEFSARTFQIPQGIQQESAPLPHCLNEVARMRPVAGDSLRSIA